MNTSPFNWLAVIVCLILSQIIGYAWYNPTFIVQAWLKDQNASSAEKNTPRIISYLLALIGAFLETVFFYNLLRGQEDITALFGAMFGVMVWLGLIASSALVNNQFSKRGGKVWISDAGYHFVYLLFCGVILGAWH
jgi:hypothetical protein